MTSDRTNSVWKELEPSVSSSWSAALVRIYQFMIFAEPSAARIGDQFRCFVERRVAIFYLSGQGVVDEWTREKATANSHLYGELVAGMISSVKQRGVAAGLIERGPEDGVAPAIARALSLDVYAPEAWPGPYPSP